MSSHQPNPTPGRRTRSSILAAVVVVAALVGVVGCRSLVGVSLPAVSGIDEAPSVDRSLDRLDGRVPGSPAFDRHLRVDVADGAVPDGVTVFENSYPAVAKVDSALLFSLRRAAADAGSEGVELYVNSGWRSPEYQEQLLAEAVAEHGSRAEAARWVATPATSPHVSGDAVDIGDDDAAAWLSERGASYGLCQIYANEPWHFELRPDAVDHGCPPSYADPTQDPRMQS
jgi:D-alanyl-D-alanine carboxypeptidase